MKTPLLPFLAIIAAICASCEDHENSRTGFIKANVDGLMKEYYTELDASDGFNGNFKTKTAIYITYLKQKGKTEHWSIQIYFPDTTTIQNMKLPYVIAGPNPDFTGDSPEFHTMILDPSGAPYGKYIAGGSTFDQDFSVTITYFNDDMIKGKFSGKGSSSFTNGEFAAKLTTLK